MLRILIITPSPQFKITAMLVEQILQLATHLLLVRTGNSCCWFCCIIWCIGGLCMGTVGACWWYVSCWLSGVGSFSLYDGFWAFMTRSLRESRREDFAVDVLGLSLSVSDENGIEFRAFASRCSNQSLTQNWLRRFRIYWCDFVDWG